MTMQAKLTRNLENLYAAYREIIPTSVSKMGMLAARDQNLYFQLRNPEKGFRIATYDQVVKWFDENWPDGAVWPIDCDRPSLEAPVDEVAA